MDNREFAQELHNIVVLIKEHGEWQYSYPAKFKSVCQSAGALFRKLIYRKTGVLLPDWYNDIPVETMKSPSKLGARGLVGRVKRDLTRLLAKLERPREIAACRDALAKWTRVYELLK